MEVNFFKSPWLMSRFISDIFKRWYVKLYEMTHLSQTSLAFYILAKDLTTGSGSK